MTETRQIVSKTEFARLSNVTPGRVSQWIKDGRIKPEHMVGEGRGAQIDVALAQADLRGSVDVAMARNEEAGGTTFDSPAAAAVRLVSDPVPEPADYRARADLPDDFARGVLYATHALAYSMPTNLACAMREQGVTAEGALAVYREGRADTSLVVADPLIAIGLVPEDADDCGPYAPTLFCGFDPNGVWS
nr:hypothetical protein NG677_04245 [Methylobacterium sp. OTU13CASTA1]